MSGERKRGFLRLDDESVAQPKKWGLPDYGAEVNKNAKETAMNYDPSWVPSFEDPVEEAPLQLTNDEIEQIKQGAYQEGLLQGQEAGFKQGYDKGKEQGIEEGRTEGLELGKSEGLVAGQSFIDEQVATFVSLANQFAQPLELMNAQVEKQLVDMVLLLVKEVVHVEVQTNPQVILDTVKQSVEALPVSGHAITLKLHPEDVDIIRQSYGDKELDFRNWTLHSEPALNRGDVQIEAGESSVNYRLEERIRSVIASFCGSNRHQGAD
ncbi:MULTISPECIES: flagellar assembly protein FliH [Vibrio]|uniref:Flagellar assembly protein FliH n=2 Tax=Vibrio genomosp. F10 TaxID=723171 RepID=A0A1B9QWQ7_9VIBR|nr:MULTISPECIES: flagellar assembly protein FliH [Vibrio]OCH74116.1 flagellar assembly protein FliH [Vibrio genomosp. F10]OEE35405.1 flagellar assembly protein FliH [Vibrio genomosp. F10 str. ZF-129]OEE94455.1 flagellar assembly protein FliH [Vibrio genomosp. F10 str. 9ZC157]OEE97713.1 flagellar assembly protein FliH [Vibrio genomosp. F10 str. 9ZD137]OEF04685.1 flagellar assembly protein FliH [Vibrio genomosp. F10 str. 9ZB36]